jgi:FAD:protein FMN transferase
MRSSFPAGLFGLLLCAALPARAPGQQASIPEGRIERRLGLMGTWLTLEVDAPTRAAALAASEAAIEALEAVDARLSTWRDDSELAALNRAPVGQAFELSSELRADLEIAREVYERTRGAFDPGVGGLVAVWGLRTGGRRPDAAEIASACVPAGFAALEFHPRSVVRTHAALVLEEGGFGKGAGLDAACRALRAARVQRAIVDLGGQVAVLTDGESSVQWDVAHPRQRELAIVRLELREGSLSTSGNGERGIEVDGRRFGHLLDPRTGSPAPDFGSITVWAADATRADAYSTGLYVLGPEAALDFARSQDDLDVLVLETLPDGGLRARATGRLAACARALTPGLELERLTDASTHAPNPPGQESRRDSARY